MPPRPADAGPTSARTTIAAADVAAPGDGAGSAAAAVGRTEADGEAVGAGDMVGASDGVAGVAGDPEARSGRRAASKAGARVRTKVAVRWWPSRYRIIPSRTTGHGVDGQTAATISMIAAPDRAAATRSRVPNVTWKASERRMAHS
jgi:hypothetical protein